MRISFNPLLNLLKFVFLLAAPIGAILLTICRVVFDIHQITYFQNSEDIVLILVSILCISVYVERELKFETLINAFEQLKESVNVAISTQYIGTREEVWISATDLVQRANSRIDVLNFDLMPNRGRYLDLNKEFLDSEDSAFKKYFETLITKLKDTENLELRVVCGYTSDNLTDTSRKIAEQTYNRFKKENVITKVNLRHRRLAPELTILVVDKNQIFIAFPSLSQDSTPRNALKFSMNGSKNSNALIENLSRWYDSYIWKEASEFEFTGSSEPKKLADSTSELK